MPPRAEARADVLVVGGGPAGLATAIGAASTGLSVTLLDPRRPPIDKACGEGWMPGGVEALRALGVEVPEHERATFAGIRYRDGETAVCGRFARGDGVGIRRVALHEALVRRAEAAGVDLRWGLAAREWIPPGVRTDRGAVEGRWVVAADGLHSPMRRRAGLDAPGTRANARPRFGVRRHYAVAPWSDCVEVHWGDGLEAYVTPVGPRLVGVALLGRIEGGFDACLARFPALARRLAGATVASRLRGAGPFARRARAVARSNLALVGDASGYVDAITGEGLSLALHDARAVVEAIRSGDLRRYAAAHARSRRLPDLLTRLALVAGRHPRPRRLFLRALAGESALFARLLALPGRAERLERALP